jgi:hypothetical protein
VSKVRCSLRGYYCEECFPSCHKDNQHEDVLESSQTGILVREECQSNIYVKKYTSRTHVIINVTTMRLMSQCHSGGHYCEEKFQWDDNDK